MVQSTTPLRVGLVGTGSIAQLHLSAFRGFPDVLELAAVCDPREDAATSVAASMGPDVAVFTDIDEMLANAELDAVDICTPHYLHAPQAIAAIQAGKHVLVEKPMACSIEEARAMAGAAEAARVTLMVGQNLRYLPGSVAVQQLLAKGELGDIWWARADDWFGLLGPVHSWAYDAKLSGGGVLHMGSTHHIDLFRFYFGNVGAVSANLWTHNPAFKNGAEDRIVATLEFESGVVAHISACYVPYKTPHRHQYMVFGHEGALHTELPESPDDRMTAILQHHAGALVSRTSEPDEFTTVAPVTEAAVDGRAFTSFPAQPPFAVSWVNELLHFADCVRTGMEPISSGRDNVETMKAVYGCYEAARLGRAVALADL